MAKCIDYSTIVACKLGSDEAMRTIIKHYEPMIMDAAKIIRKLPNATTEVYIDEEIKAHIESELMMKILLKYDPTVIPRKKRPKVKGMSNTYDLTG